MPNERSRAATAAGGWTYAALAEKAEVDPPAVSPERVALHDRRADSANVQQRGAEEKFGHGTESRV